MGTLVRLVSLLLLAPAAEAWGSAANPAALSPPPPLWQPANVPWSPSRCARPEACETALELPVPGSEEGLALRYDPRVDDAIAQWGDCLASFGACLETAARPDGPAIARCVGLSACPARCKRTFRTRLAGATDAEAAEAAFLAVFVDEGAPCLPPVGEPER